MLAFPQIILYLIIIANFGASALNIILVIALTKAPIIARIVRAVTLDSATGITSLPRRCAGESTLYIMLVEILPNARGPLIVDMFLRLGYTGVDHRRPRLPRHRPAAARSRLGRHGQGDLRHDVRLAAHDAVPVRARSRRS